MLTMLGAVAEFERTLMLERQREGIAKAKAKGKYQGRIPTAQRQAAEVLKLKAGGGNEAYGDRPAARHWPSQRLSHPRDQDAAMGSTAST